MSVRLGIASVWGSHEMGTKKGRGFRASCAVRLSGYRSAARKAQTRNGRAFGTQNRCPLLLNHAEPAPWLGPARSGLRPDRGEGGAAGVAVTGDRKPPFARHAGRGLISSKPSTVRDNAACGAPQRVK